MYSEITVQRVLLQKIANLMFPGNSRIDRLLITRSTREASDPRGDKFSANTAHYC